MGFGDALGGALAEPGLKLMSSDAFWWARQIIILTKPAPTIAAGPRGSRRREFFRAARFRAVSIFAATIAAVLGVAWRDDRWTASLTIACAVARSTRSPSSAPATAPRSVSNSRPAGAAEPNSPSPPGLRHLVGPAMLRAPPTVTVPEARAEVHQRPAPCSSFLRARSGRRSRRAASRRRRPHRSSATRRSAGADRTSRRSAPSCLACGGSGTPSGGVAIERRGPGTPGDGAAASVETISAGAQGGAPSSEGCPGRALVTCRR